MIIGIDGNEANVEEKVGVNRYAFEILWGLNKLQDDKKTRYKYIVYLSKKPRKDLPKESKNWKYKVNSGEGLWIFSKLTPHLLKNPEKIDLLFSPSHYTVPFSSIPRICSIMDLGYLKFSEQFNKLTFWQLKVWTAISIFVSKYVIAISNATKEDIVRHYPSASRKIVVTHLAYDKERFNTKISQKDVRRIKNMHSIVDDYILFLSTLKPSKNIEGVLDAFSAVRTQFPELKLVIAGSKGWMYQKIFEKVKKLRLEKEVIFTGFVNEKEKPALMAGAKIFIAPSFWEGFGLHVLEAMACGTPALVSKAGSLPEIVGKAGVIVDENDKESITDGIMKILTMDQKGYNNLVDQGERQARKFDWDKTTQKTVKIFERIDS